MNPLTTTAGPAGQTCGSCVWRFVGGRGRPVPRCRRHRNARVDPGWAACPSHEGSLDCVACGACCREAYHRVELSREDPFRALHPDRVSREGRYLVVTRAGPRCGCLQVDGGTYTCVVYGDRPQTCRDFAQGGANCVDARKRVGLTV